MAAEDLDVVGTWPDFQGKTLDSLIVQESWFEGECDDEANVVWLQAGTDWHKLYFDNNVVYWKIPLERPSIPSAERDGDSDFPMKNLGSTHQLVGKTIAECSGESIENGSQVSLKFNDGRILAFRNRFDTTAVVLS